MDFIDCLAQVEDACSDVVEVALVQIDYSILEKVLDLVWLHASIDLVVSLVNSLQEAEDKVLRINHHCIVLWVGLVFLPRFGGVVDIDVLESVVSSIICSVSS